MNRDKLTDSKIKKFYESVIHNFDLSMVMPFYKRLAPFTKVLKVNAKFLQRNGIEVILVMDEPTEKESVIELVKQYPFINWKVIVNENDHPPRNPAKAINVGIRHATKKYILVSDPEKEFYTDVILQLRELLEYYPKHYAVGTLAFVEVHEVVINETIDHLRYMDYGGLMVEKKYLTKLNGYDETFLTWGGEDDDILCRLDRIGVKKLVVEEAKSLHRETREELASRPEKGLYFSGKELKKFFYAEKAIVNDRKWGTDFNTMAYDWQNNRCAEELCKKYLDGFVKYEIKNPGIFQQQYQKLILCQAWNESEFMTGFLENMAKYFDGIILLDDGSTDTTWELANHEKLLLKVKKERTEFNDLQNRNILLDIASFFKSEWFCFMDIDERFDERYVGFLQDCKNPDYYVLAFYRIVLWETGKYNTEITEFLSTNGIMRRLRMFRHTGHMQIHTLKKKLHFTQSPLQCNIKISNTLVIDYGMSNTYRRTKKYETYIKEDKEKDLINYEYILNTNPVLCELENIDLKNTGAGLPPYPGNNLNKLQLNAVAGKDN